MLGVTLILIIFGVGGVLIGKFTSSTVITASSLIPKMDLQYFSTFSWLLLGLAGAEVAEPYLRQTKNPGKNFPRGVIIATIFVAGAYILGTVAVCFALSPDELADAGIKDGMYTAFMLIGEKWGMNGRIVAQVYAILLFVMQIASFVVWIESPLRAMFAEIPKGTFPKFLSKTREDGTMTNALWVQCLVVGAMILVPLFGLSGVEKLLTTLANLTALSAVIPYVFLAASYYIWRKKGNKPEIVLIKSNTMVKVVSIMAFIVGMIAVIGAGLDGITDAENIGDVVNILFTNYGGIFIIILLGLVLKWLTSLYYKKKGVSKENLNV